MYPNENPDVDGFDDILCAHVLKLRSNTERGTVTVIKKMDTHDDVLQSLHRWPQHAGKVKLPDIPWVRN